MSGAGIVDLAVGLAFVLGITSGVACGLTELIARFRGMRGAWLLVGIYHLLDGDDGTSTDLTRAQEDYVILRTALRPEVARGSDARAFAAAGARASASPSATGALLGSPILRSQGMTGQISDRRLTLKSAGQEGRLATLQTSPTRARWRECRSLPSYIPARSFAEAIIGLLVPAPAWLGTMTTIQQSVNALPPSMSTLRRSLGTLANSAGGDIGRFRALVEQWYDDQMERVSGWYERRVSAVTLVIAVLLVLLLNINVVTLGRALYSDAVIRAAASTAVANGTSCPAGPEQQACLASLEERVSSTLVAGLPIGWRTIPGCKAVNARCNWLDKRGILSSHGDSGGQVTIILIGFLVTIVALILGARLWSRLLARLGSLRATGPKPATSASPKSATSASPRQARSGTEAIMARSRYSWWPVIAVGAAIVGTIAFAAYAVRAGVQHLAAGHTPKDAANSLWHLVILSVAAGILSYAVVEFAKRQTRMRSFFNARIVEARFGEDLDFPQHLRDSLPEDARRSLPLGTGIAISDPISYSGSIQQVTAQISLQLRQLVQLAASPEP